MEHVTLTCEIVKVRMAKGETTVLVPGCPLHQEQWQQHRVRCLQYPKYSRWSNRIVLEGATPDLATGAETSNIDEAFCQNARPYTSMLPLDYKDYYSDYGHSDNLSTYSDTPPVTISAVQHKLQQQRKISLMMAMTTASVIASGETRIAVHMQKQQQHSQQRVNNYSSTDFNNQIGYRSTASTTDVFSIGMKEPDLVDAPTTHTTPTATTTRKLPKRLPSPQYKTLLNTSSLSVTENSSLQVPLPEFTDALSLPQSETKIIAQSSCPSCQYQRLISQ
ncbi:uncharacterized protein LOC133846907 [Drosophila sulfurigaster albostrigata]|uniref:uncharacterized protein LOC133846907 n=1 Tax=Drosophila sulfurigaster albostrigata TaxID=89887 RepID=UPI002D219018|nr:uncharacterized protein LOC133846907 [Drosophila sulfurigaster albostrigata]